VNLSRGRGGSACFIDSLLVGGKLFRQLQPNRAQGIEGHYHEVLVQLFMMRYPNSAKPAATLPANGLVMAMRYWTLNCDEANLVVSSVIVSSRCRKYFCNRMCG
jgi:hypothetical protein